MNKKKLITNPTQVLRDAGFIKPNNGYIYEDARLRARKKRKKKKK